ncbi:MAG TPA: IPTL-CTERM sorting domain-containing protein [Thermodesulfobacteriota bacterium]|nr:IPTL-CTERM sorting domain-containing protein [Thermodesulfobacteriota bacterium]
MSSMLRTAAPVYVFIVFIACLFLIPALSDSAQAQCEIVVCKLSPNVIGEGESFTFIYSGEGTSGQFNLTANSVCDGTTFGGNDFELVEDTVPGWILEDVQCGDVPGINVSFIEDGVSLDCIQSNVVTCTFTNVRGVISNIPTLSEWGMIAAAAGLALIGVFFAVRRKRLQASNEFDV